MQRKCIAVSNSKQLKGSNSVIPSILRMLKKKKKRLRGLFLYFQYDYLTLVVILLN